MHHTALLPTVTQLDLFPLQSIRTHCYIHYRCNARRQATRALHATWQQSLPHSHHHEPNQLKLD